MFGERRERESGKVFPAESEEKKKKVGFQTNGQTETDRQKDGQIDKQTERKRETERD